MKIKRIKIDRFGGLYDFSLDFSEGFNLIFGNNEDGKTTVLSFLRLMFYGESAGGGDLHKNLRRRFTPFSGESMGGEVEFSFRGRDYILSKQFGKSGKTDKTVLIDLSLGSPLPLEGEVGEELFGMSCAAFERSIFITGFTPAEDGSAELSARLAALLSSGDDKDSYADIKERFDSAKNRMHTKFKKGSADLAATRLLDLELELQRAVENEQLRAENEQRLSATRARIDELEGKKTELSSLLAQCTERERRAELSATLARRKDALELEKQLGDLTTQKLNEAEQLLLKAEQLSLTDNTDTSAEIPEPSEALIRLREAQTAVAEIKKKIAACEGEKTAKNNSALYFTVAFLFAAAAAAGAFASLIFLALLLPTATLAVLGILNRSKAQNERQLTLLSLQQQLRDADESERALDKEYAVLSEQRRIVLENRRIADGERARRKALSQECREKAYSLISFGGGDAATFISECRRNLSRIEALREWLAASPYRDMTNGEIAEKLSAHADDNLKSSAEYASDIKALEQEINLSHAQAARLMTENEALLRRGRTVGVIENDIIAAKQRLSAMEAHYEALCLASKLLDEAYDEMRRNFAPELNRQTSELLAAMTSGTHRRATVSNDLAITVTQDGTVPFSADYLSAGTLDQAELCLRLSIAKLTGGERQLPLLLDDVLAQYDDARAQKATRFLSDYAKENQVLLFTCHGYFKDMAVGTGANIVNMK